MNSNNSSSDPFRPPRLATPVSNTTAAPPSRQTSHQTSQDAYFTPAYERSASELVGAQRQQAQGQTDDDSLPYDLYATDRDATPRKNSSGRNVALAGPGPLYAEPEPLPNRGLTTSPSFDTINTPTTARNFFPGGDESTMDRSTTSDSRMPLNVQAYQGQGQNRERSDAQQDSATVAARDYAAAQVHYPPSAAMRAEPSAASATASEDEGYARLPPAAASANGGQIYTSVPLDAPVVNNAGNNSSPSGFTSSKPPGKKNRLSAMFGKNPQLASAMSMAREDELDTEKGGAHQRLASTEGGGGSAGRAAGGRATRFAADPSFPDRSGASTPGHGGHGGATPPRSGLRSGFSTPGREWEGFEFNTAQASVENLRFAEGDVGKSKLAKSYYYLLSKSIVTRWFLYIFPVLVLLWVPGIVWLAGVRTAAVWSVNLLWWSIWLTVLWGGWWAALAVAMFLPHFVRYSLVTIAPTMRQWVDILHNLERPIAFIGWSLAIWITWTPLIINHFNGDGSSTSRTNLTTIANLLFGLFLSSLVVGGEKLIIQLIAYRFHRDSYEDRIREQKLQTKSIVTLYINSHDIPGRSDTMTDADLKRERRDPKRAIRKALKGLRSAAATTTTAIGNVATEMTGQSVLQTNSPYNRVNTALTSANKSKALARRLFYSFRQPGADHLTINDIVRYFPDYDSALVAFATFDRDGNGDATRDEIDMALLQMHREKMSLEASMRDLDGAVNRLDSIFMVIVLLVIVLIMSAMVTNKLTTLVTSTGTFVLGLSWLIGTTMQEILGACIFLFVKHPFDVGDRVDVDGSSYVVASMQLMSTTFRRTDGTYTFIGNDILRSKYIHNIRRSGPISETFIFEVDFATDFKKLQELRDKMLIFLKTEARDYRATFDVVVDDMPGQGKLVLKADIPYRTNWQEGALKTQRRNKWVCALKNALADCQIFGPAGAGNPAPAPADPVAYMQVPYGPPYQQDANNEGRSLESPPPDFAAATAGASQGAALMDRNEVINDRSGNIYDEDEEPMSGAATPNDTLRQRLPHARVAGENLER